MRFAYADPPYPGQAKKHYGPDAREVNHRLLVNHLETFDGWALSTNNKSLRSVLALCPEPVRVLAWCKPISPPLEERVIRAWEPVILRGEREGDGPRPKDWLVASPPQYTFRPKPENHVIGEKPLRFWRWLFHCAGLRQDDEFVDLFPGSGAGESAWSTFQSEPEMRLTWRSA